MKKTIIISLVLSSVIFLSGCGGNVESSTDPSSSESTNNENSDYTNSSPDETPVEKTSLIIPVYGNTVRYFTFEDEKVLMTGGCVSAKLYDSSNTPLSSPWIATKGDYTYIANNAFNNGHSSSGIVYAKSMDIEPEPLIGGKAYSVAAGGKDIKKLVINETTTLVVSRRGGINTYVYDSNLEYLMRLSGSESFGPGTYYILWTNSSCKNGNKEIAINFL